MHFVSLLKQLGTSLSSLSALELWQFALFKVSIPQAYHEHFENINNNKGTQRDGNNDHSTGPANTCDRVWVIAKEAIDGKNQCNDLGTKDNDGKRPRRDVSPAKGFNARRKDDKVRS